MERYTQPQYGPLRIDPFWIEQGLIDVIDMTGKPRSLMLGTPATAFGTTPTYGSVAEKGKVLDASAAFGGVYFQRSDGAYTPAAITQISVCRVDSVTGNYAGLFATADGSGANGSFGFQYSSSSEMYVYPGPTLCTVSSQILVQGWIVLGVSIANPGYVDVYKNGQNITHVSNPYGACPTYSTSRLVLFGERAASSSYATKGKSALHLIFNCVLSAESHASLAANPWQIFKASSVPLKASAGGGTTNASIGSIDSQDITEVTAAATTGASVSTTDTADISSITAVAGGLTSASIASVDGADASSVTSTNWMTAQLTEVDSSDSITIASSATTGAGVVAIDFPDTTIILVTQSGVTSASVAASESPDVTVITTSWTTGAAISGTDGADSAIIAALNWTTAQIAATDSADSIQITGFDSVTPFTIDQIAYLNANYMTISDVNIIAAAVLAAMNAAPPAVNVLLMNSAPVIGTGQDSDKWRGAGVPN